MRWACDGLWALQLALEETSELQLDRDLEVRPAKGKGMGVFALRRIPEGVLVGRYDAPVRTLEDSCAAEEAGVT